MAEMKAEIQQNLNAAADLMITAAAKLRNPNITADEIQVVSNAMTHLNRIVDSNRVLLIMHEATQRPNDK